MTDEPTYVAETLAWCNQMRAGKGQDPLDRLPKGSRMNGFDCPCGAATGVFVGRTTWGYELDEANRSIVNEKPLPSPVVVFVDAFDRGDLPEYDNHPIAQLRAARDES